MSRAIPAQGYSLRLPCTLRIHHPNEGPLALNSSTSGLEIVLCCLLNCNLLHSLCTYALNILFALATFLWIPNYFRIPPSISDIFSLPFLNAHCPYRFSLSLRYLTSASILFDSPTFGWISFSIPSLIPKLSKHFLLPDSVKTRSVLYFYRCRCLLNVVGCSRIFLVSSEL